MAGRCSTIGAVTPTRIRSEPVSLLTTSTIGVEALDSADCDPALARRMLCDIARSNRWLGGARAARRGLMHLLDPADQGRTLTLLDVGTGAGDLPRALERWSAKRGVVIRSLGVELIPAAARLAHASGMPVMLGDGGALPLADRSVDLVLASQFAHHLDDAGAVALMRECARVARRGVIIADLRPSRAAAWGYRAVAPLLRLHPVTVADGIVSLARGRDAAALMTLAHRAGAANVHTATLPCARVVLAWRSST